MSASNLWRYVFEVFQDLTGWLAIAPVSMLMPRRRDWIAVIGREGKFIDNAKYFFIDASTSRTHDLKIVYVSECDDVVKAITDAGFKALRYPSLRATWFLMRCGCMVADSSDWHKKWRRFLVCRAHLIQLWHGVGFKRIELDMWRNEVRLRGKLASKWLFRLRLLRHSLSGRTPKYDAVVTTSRFYRDNVFSTAFRTKHTLTTGYPRNNFSSMHALAWINVDRTVQQKLDHWKRTARKLVLVAPTFRDSRATALGLDKSNISKLEAFCDEHGFEFIFKFHQYEHGVSDISGRHLHTLHPSSDAYPMLPSMSFLVTDYSSIYMDFLLLDKPILFLTPDLERYMSSDRAIQFDFESMTPGPKLKDWDEVLGSLLAPEQPRWREMREKLKAMAFDENDQKTQTYQLLDFAENLRWIRRRDTINPQERNVRRATNNQ